ncbi:MAG: CRISPR-associated endonuclease Cas2 [Candidatus Obscuribacterales bacterium]|nr:CRISPR-associated endonuclease Cas2 [Candidatus Obscuribacterales bacterium]
MIILAIYDIEDDRIRTKISETCKDYGLQRIQFSAFLGDLSASRRDELMVKLKKLLGVCIGNIQIITLCDKDARLRKIIDVPKTERQAG